MVKKYAGLLVVLLGLSYCYALEDELSYLADALNQLASFLPMAEPRSEFVRKIIDFEPGIKGIVQVQSDVIPREGETLPSLSGYSSVYFVFGELVHALKGTSIALSFEEFRDVAVRAIKRRRIRVVCQKYIFDKLRTEYLESEAAVALFESRFKISPFAIRDFYFKILGDFARTEAERFVRIHYQQSKNGTQYDELENTPFVVKGQALIAQYQNLSESRRKDYAAEIVKKFDPQVNEADRMRINQVYFSALNALIQEPNLLKQYAKIDPTTEFALTGKDILNRLHDEFELEERTTPKGDMPMGRWLYSADLDYLKNDQTLLKRVGLAGVNVSEMVNVFDNLKDKAEYDVLTSIAADKRKLHAFIVNSGDPIQITWIGIVRYPQPEYIIADVANQDRRDSDVVHEIQRVFGDA